MGWGWGAREGGTPTEGSVAPAAAAGDRKIALSSSSPTFCSDAVVLIVDVVRRRDVRGIKGEKEK